MLTSPLLLMATTTPLLSEEQLLFRESAARILVEKGLHQSERNAFVCVSLDGQPPSDTDLTRYRALGIRSIGKPSECVCSQGQHGPDEYKCVRTETREPACIVNVFDFEFRTFNNATATLLVSCGWPNGGGEKAQFEKVGETWLQRGTESSIRF